MSLCNCIDEPMLNDSNEAHKSNGSLVWPIYILILISAMWLCYTGLVLGMNTVNTCSTPYIVVLVLIYVPVSVELALAMSGPSYTTSRY